MNNLEVFIYLRKSRRDIEMETTAANEGRSYDTLERHRKQLLNFAKDKQHRVLNIYQEVVSGEFISERPQMQQMLEDIQNTQVDAVLVMDIDRLGRGDMADQGTIFRVLKYSETKIITPTETINPGDDNQELNYSIKALVAREELKAINKRLLRGIRMSAAEGKHLGAPPFGYVKNKDLRLEIDKDKAWVVKKIFDMYCEGITKKEIEIYLNERGILSPRGQHWTDSSVTKILKREAYVGDLVYQKKKSRKVNGKYVSTKTSQDEQIIVRDAHEPIISREQFEKAQQVMQERWIAPVNVNAKLRNPLAGVLRCHLCDVLIQCDYSIKKRGYRPRYTCMSVSCKGKGVQKSSIAEIVEAKVLKSLEQVLAEFKLHNKENTKQSNSHLVDELKKQYSLVEKEIKSLEEKLDVIYEYFEDKKYDINTFTVRQSRVTQQIKEKKETLEMLDMTLEQEELKILKSNMDENIKTLESVIHAIKQTNDPQKKNRLYKSILEKATYYRNPKSKDTEDFEIQLYLRF